MILNLQFKSFSDGILSIHFWKMMVDKVRWLKIMYNSRCLTSAFYGSVVSCESVRIALTIAALNDLNVKTADIENAYLTAPVGEKTWCRLGPEFGDDAAKEQ